MSDPTIREGDQVYRPYDEEPCAVLIVWDDGTAFVASNPATEGDEWGSSSIERTADLVLVTEIPR